MDVTVTEARLHETRVYEPSNEFSNANVTAEAYARAAADPVAFWEDAARRLDWVDPWHTAHEWEPPTNGAIPAARWFVGGRLNVAVNCVDRHVEAGVGDRVALHFEGEPGDRASVTYAELQQRVSRAANALVALGIGPGDRVVIYLPVLVETIVITLACARVGAVHSLVFGGFSAEAVRFRLEDTGAKLLVTSDGQYRRGTATEVKSTADLAAADLPGLEHVLVLRRTGQEVPWTDGRDVWWHDVVDPHRRSTKQRRSMPSIRSSSSTPPAPPVSRRDSCTPRAATSRRRAGAHWAHFDAKPDDVHWCTADLAWVTAHTYEIYGPLSNGLTQVIYEGTPDTPHHERHLEIIERYGVTVYYTAPTLIRTFMTWFGADLPTGHDLSSLRLLGTVGEAINPEAWVWFRRKFGRDELPVIDTWWQSETGAAMIAPLPGVTSLKPGSASVPLPGLDVAVVDELGQEVEPGRSGTLVIRRPWPGMARTIWGNPNRYRDAYWSAYAGHGEFGGFYVAGDGATRDADGYIWILGRLDDVVNVSGHRLSTIEIESALVAHDTVGEAGSAGVSDPVTGQAVVAFVTPSGRAEVTPSALRAQVAQAIGPVAKPKHIVIVPDLPKTRSGKIMRRLLAQLWEAEQDRRAGREPQQLGDTTSLQNPWAVGDIADVLAAAESRTS
jgi:acetyl-CoA synthetase